MKRAIWAAVLLTMMTLNAGTQTKTVEHRSCRGFVQNFYDWYVPLANRGDLKEASSNVALRRKPFVFTSRLYRALKAESDAQARSKELVGIDFDPFLNSQDPDPRYELGKVTETENRCSVEVSGAREGNKRSQPDVIPELLKTGEGWKFMNFRYPGEKSDLLRVLQAQAEERRKSGQ